jgi:hypothetical protein
MYTTAPDVDISVTVGQIVVQATATPTSTPSSAATPTSSPLATPSVVPTTTPHRYIQNALSIYGYGPVDSVVTLIGIGVSERTSTDSDGLFIFSPIYSYSYIYPELCIQAIDSQKRTTSMACIPGLSKTGRIPLTVGPIFLSPTVSLSENWKVLGESSFLEGVTAPNTEVNVYIAGSYFLPIIQTKSDKDGKFSISLPTSNVSDYKVFVSSRFGDNLSAKSNILNFVVTSKTESFLDRLLGFIFKNKLLTIIILEILVIIILIFKLLKLTTRGKKRHTERDYLKYITS